MTTLQIVVGNLKIKYSNANLQIYVKKLNFALLKKTNFNVYPIKAK